MFVSLFHAQVGAIAEKDESSLLGNSGDSDFSSTPSYFWLRSVQVDMWHIYRFLQILYDNECIND
jgi:hypothetical protein